MCVPTVPYTGLFWQGKIFTIMLQNSFREEIFSQITHIDKRRCGTVALSCFKTKQRNVTFAKISLAKKINGIQYMISQRNT